MKNQERILENRRVVKVVEIKNYLREALKKGPFGIDHAVVEYEGMSYRLTITKNSCHCIINPINNVKLLIRILDDISDITYDEVSRIHKGMFGKHSTFKDQPNAGLVDTNRELKGAN